MLLFLLFFVTVRGQEQCIRKERNKVTTDTYKVIAKKESATSIDLCEKECIKVLLFYVLIPTVSYYIEW